jgi:hypothetical protein
LAIRGFTASTRLKIAVFRRIAILTSRSRSF